jgi:hypothetical protein
MDSARRRRLRWTFGILASVVFNALLISTVAFQQPIIRSIGVTDDRKVMNTVLVVLPAAPSTPRRGSPERPPPRLPVQAAPSRGDRKPAATLPAPAATSPSPQTAPVKAPDDEAEVRAKVAKALRGLSACAKFEVGPQDRQRPPCGKAWDAPGPEIDPVPAELRAQNQAEKSRSDDAVKVGNRFRSDLRDHAGQGNNAHFGCWIDTGGKVKCSTY